MSSPDSQATVLVVDDEPDVADAYSLRLDQEYSVRTAYGGEDALETVDGEVDVVLLDRRMPDMSGDEVLDAFRERGYDCGVIMVTAVDPDFDIIDMPFDDYLQKPVDRETLFDAIDDQRETQDKDEAVSELFSVTAKTGVLEQRKSREELADHPEYQQLKQRAEELREQIHGETAGEVDDPTGPGVDADDGATADSPEPGDDTAEEGATARSEEEDSPGLVGRILGLFGG
jgi:DNA-binding NtrC family response regulator